MPLRQSLQRLSLLIFENMGALKQFPQQSLSCAAPCASSQAATNQQRSCSSSSSSSDNASTSQTQAHHQESSGQQGHGSTAGPASSLGSMSIEQLRAEVFGAPVLPHERTGRRVLARKLQGAEMASWYFNPPTVPGIHNEEREYVLLRKKNKRVKKQGDDEDGGK